MCFRCFFESTFICFFLICWIDKDQLHCQQPQQGLRQASHEGLEVPAGHTDDAQLPALPGPALVGALAFRCTAVGIR